MAADFWTLLDDIDGLSRAFAGIEPSLKSKQREHLGELFASPDGEPADRLGKNRVVKSRTRVSCSQIGQLMTGHFGGVGPNDQMMWIGLMPPPKAGQDRWAMRPQIREALSRLGWFGEGPTTEHVDAGQDQEADFEERAERFALVKVRTEQAVFRKLVFKACGGCCVISGNAVPQALEAAHLRGRSWHEGQNAASDGVLLRRDLHALYDSSLLSIEKDGRVVFHPDVAPNYLEFSGSVVSATAFSVQKR